MNETAHGFPRQQQPRPGHEAAMDPAPRAEMEGYVASGKLDGMRALITGGDSGIGRAVSVAFAKEGADVAIAYLSEHDDAGRTAELVDGEGRRSVRIPGDLSQPEHCAEAVQRTVDELGGLEVLVNNIAYQAPTDEPEDITAEQWERTFRTNVHSYFWTTQAALPHLEDGASIINTSSINGLRGNKALIDYSATKGAILAYTYSMAQALAGRGIRVNAVAPGPVWTPLIPSTLGPESVEQFGTDQPIGRAAQPDEIAPSYVFFASRELSGYYSGEVLAPVGGETLPA